MCASRLPSRWTDRIKLVLVAGIGAGIIAFSCTWLEDLFYQRDLRARHAAFQETIIERDAHLAERARDHSMSRTEALIDARAWARDKEAESRALEGFDDFISLWVEEGSKENVIALSVTCGRISHERARMIAHDLVTDREFAVLLWPYGMDREVSLTYNASRAGQRDLTIHVTPAHPWAP